MVGYATGLLGNACDFESTNVEYLDITDANQTGLEPTSFTINTWVKTESNTPYFVGKAYTTTHNPPYTSYVMGVDGDVWKDQASASLTTGSLNLSAGTVTFNTGTWYMETFVFDDTANLAKTYVNGSVSQSGSPSYSVSYSDGQFRIGAHPSYPNSGYTFDGLQDEITFFNTALNSTDIATLYNSGTPLPYTLADTSTTSTSTASTTTSSGNSDDIVFGLAIIIFFLTFIWFGFIINSFRTRIK